MTTEVEAGLLPKTRLALRQIDYSALDRETVERALDDFVRATFPEQRDFLPATGYKIIQRMISYVMDLLSYRADYLTNNNYLPTCTNLRALDNLLALIGYQRAGPQPARTDIVIVPQEVVGTAGDPNDQKIIRIPARTVISGTGADGLPTTFELFASATNLFSEIEIGPGQNNVRAFGLEGESKTVITKSTGQKFQQVVLPDLNVIAESVRINIGTFDTTNPNVGTEYEPALDVWERVSFLVLHGAEDVYEVRRLTDGLASIQWGDGNFGSVPSKDQDIIINYRVGGGNNGNVLPEALRGNGNFSVYQGGLRSPDSMKVTMVNVSRGAGGRTEETLDEAKFLAPLVYQAQQRAVKDIDYTAFALRSPLVAKAVAVSRQQIVVDSFEDSLEYEFPLAETQPYTLKLQIHRLDLRQTQTYTANLTVPLVSYTSVDALLIALNEALGWEYNADSLAFQETVPGEGFIAYFDKSVEGFIELWINTGNYQARATLLESGNSLLPIMKIGFGSYGRVDANYIDIYMLAFAEDGNIITPTPAIADELRTYFEEVKELQTVVTIRRGFIQRVNINADVYLERSADPQQVKFLVDQAIQEIFSSETRELGEPLYVSKVYEAIEAVEGVAYLDQFIPAQNVVPDKQTLLQLGTVDIPFFEAQR